jgi:hypothetical protein
VENAQPALLASLASRFSPLKGDRGFGHQHDQVQSFGRAQEYKHRWPLPTGKKGDHSPPNGRQTMLTGRQMVSCPKKFDLDSGINTLATQTVVSM